MTENKRPTTKTTTLVYIALFTVLIAVCSWITIPTVVPFTLQTFAVFCAVGILGGKRGAISVLLYIALGFIGIPVFAGFRGGAGELLGPTGGYIIGFIFMALVAWLIIRLFGERTVAVVCAMLTGLLVLYAFGTAWFMLVYSNSAGSPVGLMTALGWCVFPFILPDLIKLALAVVLVKRLKPHVRL